MARFCLIPEKVIQFKRALKDRSIDPFKLSQMSSEDRHIFLERFVGKENVTQVNALFESKLLLKRQIEGYKAWAKKVTGLSPEAKRDLISRIEKMDKVLSPKEGEQFLKDLAETKLGIGVSESEAKTIFDLSKKIQETRALQKKDLTFASEVERLNYGRAKVALMNYTNDLKELSKKLGAKERINPKNYLRNLSDIAGNAKSIKASLDVSGLLRQGWKTLFTNPIIWQKNARKTFVDVFKTFGGKNVMDEIMADIISRPNYERMTKAKLAIGNIEEAFPGTILEKIPGAGRAFKASENAYTGFAYRMRADIFDKYLEIAKKSGINIDDVDELKPIASMVNSLTGRGNLGKFEGSGANLLNNVFFSPRFIKSQIDSIGHLITGAGGSNFVRKQAAMNLLKVVSGTAAILVIADAIKPGSVEWDSRSSDFGKIKVGNTRFEVTGGVSPLVTLASRWKDGASKSTTTGIVSKLDTGKFGAPTTRDIIDNYFDNKLSPIASVINDLAIRKKTFKGEKPTVLGETANLLLPLPISTYQELKSDPNSADTLLSMIASTLGIGVNTYGIRERDWTENPGKELKQFQQKIGEDKFKEANNKYNKEYSEWISKQIGDNEYKALSDEEKQKLVSDKKEEIKQNIYKLYDFKYKLPPREKKKSGSLFK